MKNTILIALFVGVSLPACSQYKYGLKPMNHAEYTGSIQSNPEKELVDLAAVIPGIILDIRYATKDNFTGERIYDFARAFARKPVADALKQAQSDLRKQGLGIKVFDAYRPYRATVKFYEVYGDTTYVASPYRGSRHNRGCAIDMTLVDLQTGNELKMPTEYDSFTKLAWPSTHIADPEIRKNRQVLIETMERHGFRVNSSEWWHFDFTGWKNFEVLDIDFSEL